MLFFRRFTHQFLPILLLALSAVAFCLFTFQPLTASINQVQVLSRATYNEMFYSTDPYEVEKKDTFSNLNSLVILTHGKRSMSCDMYMELPSYEYTSALPFYDEAMNTIQKGECLVSENVLSMRHAKVGDMLSYRGIVDKGEVRIAGKLPSMKGYEFDHYGVIVIGYDRDVDLTARATKPRYMTFGKDFKEFGNIHVEGNILAKENDIQREYRIIIPRVTIGIVALIGIQSLIALAWAYDDQKERRAIIISGTKPIDVFWYFCKKKLLYRLLPVAVVFALFLMFNLVYVQAGLVIFGVFALLNIVVSFVETAVLTWRS